MIDHINRHTAAHHDHRGPDRVPPPATSARSSTSARSGSTPKSSAQALRSALRQDPDVILVGEMRDLETIETALTAAETGHLVIRTLHTLDAAETINRIIDVFPPTSRSRSASQLAGVLEAVICQRLVPRADGKGRVRHRDPARPTPAVRELIRENKPSQIMSTMQTSAKEGMHRLETHLTESSSPAPSRATRPWNSHIPKNCGAPWAGRRRRRAFPPIRCSIGGSSARSPTACGARSRAGSCRSPWWTTCWRSTPIGVRPSPPQTPRRRSGTGYRRSSPLRKGSRRRCLAGCASSRARSGRASPRMKSRRPRAPHRRAAAPDPQCLGGRRPGRPRCGRQRRGAFERRATHVLVRARTALGDRRAAGHLGLRTRRAAGAQPLHRPRRRRSASEPRARQLLLGTQPDGGSRRSRRHCS